MMPFMLWQKIKNKFWELISWSFQERKLMRRILYFLWIMRPINTNCRLGILMEQKVWVCNFLNKVLNFQTNISSYIGYLVHWENVNIELVMRNCPRLIKQFQLVAWWFMFKKHQELIKCWILLIIEVRFYLKICLKLIVWEDEYSMCFWQKKAKKHFVVAWEF